MAPDQQRLFKPFALGSKHNIKSRIGMAAVSRFRSPDSVPLPSVTVYYTQRASTGALQVTEGISISEESGGYSNAPGIFTKDHINAWKKVVSSVHSEGGIFYCQLMALGRLNPGVLVPRVVAPSTEPSPDKDMKIPGEMTSEDITRYVRDYVHAAKCAIEAGFDGCEIAAAHGYLIDQFLQSGSNNTRSDQYSGSVENRARFLLEVVEAVSKEIGQDRLSVRISPFSTQSGMGSEGHETFEYVCRQIVQRCPKLAYISVTNARNWKRQSSDFYRGIFRGVDLPPPPSAAAAEDVDEDIIFPDPDEAHPTAFFSCGGYNEKDAIRVAARTGDIVGFGKMFISTPDLVHRILFEKPVNRDWDKGTFCTQGDDGYITYERSIDENK